MPENLYIEKHKYSNPKWREGWDRIFIIEKQCLFCGNDAKLKLNADGTGWIECPICHSCEFCRNKEEAMRFWNKRQPINQSIM